MGADNVTLARPYKQLLAAVESVFGTTPAGAIGDQVEVHGLEALSWVHAAAERDPVRLAMTAAPVLPGRMGGEGPLLRVPVVSVAAARATAGTDFAPDNWAKTLLRAVLSDGALAIASAGAPTVNQGRVCGGDTAATAVDAAGVITSVTLSGAFTGRFDVGDYIGLETTGATTGLPYFCKITSINAGLNTLYVADGPLTTDLPGTPSTCTVYGAWTLPIQEHPLLDDSVSIDTCDIEITPTWILHKGCSGGLKAAFKPGEHPFFEFALSHNEAVRGAAVTIAERGGVGGSPWPGRAHVVARDMAVRVAVSGAGNSTLLPTSGCEFDAGLQRVEAGDICGPQGRHGRPFVSSKPTLTIHPHFAPDWITRFSGSTSLTAQVVFGSRSLGGFGVCFGKCKLANHPAVVSDSGLRRHDVVLQAEDDNASYASANLFFF